LRRAHEGRELVGHLRCLLTKVPQQGNDVALVDTKIGAKSSVLAMQRR
jgi:hypothetical protein